MNENKRTATYIRTLSGPIDPNDPNSRVYADNVRLYKLSEPVPTFSKNVDDKRVPKQTGTTEYVIALLDFERVFSADTFAPQIIVSVRIWATADGEGGTPPTDKMRAAGNDGFVAIVGQIPNFEWAFNRMGFDVINEPGIDAIVMPKWFEGDTDDPPPTLDDEEDSEVVAPTGLSAPDSSSAMLDALRDESDEDVDGEDGNEELENEMRAASATTKSGTQQSGEGA